MDGTPGSTAGRRRGVDHLERIRKRYPDGTEAVRELSLQVGAGELVV